jgi:hypothetical protein
VQLEKDLISLNPHSFERIEEYLVHVKEMRLKLGEWGESFQKKDGQPIELVVMNLRASFDVLLLHIKIPHFDSVTFSLLQLL